MNAIVRGGQQSTALDRFGDQETMQTFMQRGAAIFQVTPDDLKYPENQGALMKAMQWTMTYGAMPGRHIHLIPSTKSEKVGNDWISHKVYAVADSFEWRKASADQKSLQMGWRYMCQTEPLTPEELKKYATENKQAGAYDVTDKGYRSRVIFSHEMAMAKEMGFVYSPPWHYGFWRKNAYCVKAYGNKPEEWKPDNIPSGRTADWVALKRAEKSALAQHFELQPIANWEQLNERQKVAQIENGIAAIEPLPERINSDKLTYEPVTTDEEGVFIAEPVRPAPAPQQRRQAPAGTPGANVLNALTVDTTPVTEPPLQPATPASNGRVSTPHTRLFGEGVSTFSPKVWDEVRPVIVGIVTNGAHSSESDLTDEEREMLTNSFKDSRRYWQQWAKTKNEKDMPKITVRPEGEEVEMSEGDKLFAH